MDETLHAVSTDVLEQLIRGVLGKRENWSEFTRLNRITSEILRSTGQKLERPTRRPFGLPADQPQKNALQLLALYQTGSTQLIIPVSLFPLSRRKLGLKEAVRYLRGLYEKKSTEEFEVEFGYVLAQLSYLTLPTWRTGGMGLSFLWRMGWEKLKASALNPVHDLPDLSAKGARPLETSFSSGIYLNPAGIANLDRALRSREREGLVKMAIAKQVPASEFEPALNIVSEAVYFAREFGCGLIEATGILDEDTMVTPV